jgi:hypothetical protein
MRTKVGLWSDHRKAFIVAVTPTGERTHLVISRVDKQLGRPRGVRSTSSFESQLVKADDRQQRRLTRLYDRYYDAVIASLRGAESILILGPGEAKGELQQRLKKDRLAGRVVGVETADKMSDRQIEARVRAQFRTHGGRNQDRAHPLR